MSRYRGVSLSFMRFCFSLLSSLPWPTAPQPAERPGLGGRLPPRRASLGALPRRRGRLVGLVLLSKVRSPGTLTLKYHESGKAPVCTGKWSSSSGHFATSMIIPRSVTPAFGCQNVALRQMSDILLDGTSKTSTVASE